MWFYDCLFIDFMLDCYEDKDFLEFFNLELLKIFEEVYVEFNVGNLEVG